MRAPVFLASSLLSLGLGACWQEPSNTSGPVQVAPIAPIKDWASVASRKGAKKNESEHEAAAVLAQPSEAARLVPGADSDDGARPRAESPAAKQALSGAQAELGPSETGRHALYTRLAKDSLLVIGISDLGQLHGAFVASELGRLYQRPELEATLRPALAAIETGLAELRAQSPAVGAALELLPTLGGQVAISLSGVTPETLAATPTGLLWVVTVVYAAGDRSDRVAEVIAPLLAALAERRGWPLLEKPEPAWGCEIGDERFLLDLERREGAFELRFGGRAAVIRELVSSRKRAEANSFFSSRVAVDTSSVEALGARGVLEAHLQLTSLWDSIRASGNRSDQRVLARTGLTQFHGASMAVGRTERGLAEALTLHSPAGLDLITHALTGQALDLDVARAVPAGLANAGLYSFDGTRLIPDICLLVPGPAQGAIVRAVGEFRREVGVDLEKDLLGNFGPTIAVATNGLQFGAPDPGHLPSAFVACQVGDPARAQRTLNALLFASGKSADAREQLIDGERIFSLEIPLEAQETSLELHWCMADGVLLACTELELLRDGLRGLRGEEVVHAGLRRALAGAKADCFAVGFTQGDAQTPDSLMLGRRTSAGLELTSSDGSGVQSTILSLFSAGVVSSIAIPTLLKLRLEANERAATSTLTVVNDAQVMARTRTFLDADGDGLGEYLFLPELCGAQNLRGSSEPLLEPWLDGDFHWVAPGVGAKSGYRFRIDLITSDRRSVSSTEGLGESILDVDAAEEGFLAYAWPMESTSGAAVFVFDSATGLYSSNNRATSQHYCGEIAPAAGAHTAAQGVRSEETRYVGRDGGIWLRLRGP